MKTALEFDAANVDDELPNAATPLLYLVVRPNDGSGPYDRE